MMSRVQASRPFAWDRGVGWLLLCLGLCTVSTTTACGKAKEARGDTIETPATTADAERAASQFDETAFTVALRAVGDYRATQAARAEVVLTAKEPYHVNAEFPLNLKLRESPGLKYARPVVAKDMAKLEPKRAVVPIEFTPETPGRKVVAGVLRFSVCNDQRCLVEKRSLELGINVQ